MITTEDIIRFNREFGGHLVRDSSLAFAESVCKTSRSKNKCMATWIRAIIVDHPFTDGNKRTAMAVIDDFKGLKNEVRVARALVRIARENVADLEKIEEMISNANR
ncbi:Fic family protein [Nanoarchaeota archaeon]